MKTGKFLTIILMNLLSINIYAHKEWVHQYIVGEGFKLLEDIKKYPLFESAFRISQSDLDDLKSKIFFSDGSLLQGLGTANDDAPWEDGLEKEKDLKIERLQKQIK